MDCSKLHYKSIKILKLWMPSGKHKCIPFQIVMILERIQKIGCRLENAGCLPLVVVMVMIANGRQPRFLDSILSCSIIFDLFQSLSISNLYQVNMKISKVQTDIAQSFFKSIRTL